MPFTTNPRTFSGAVGLDEHFTGGLIARRRCFVRGTPGPGNAPFDLCLLTAGGTRR